MSRVRSRARSRVRSREVTWDNTWLELSTLLSDGSGVQWSGAEWSRRKDTRVEEQMRGEKRESG
eukprot:2538253-Rhodomonas_salina.1